MLRKKRKGYTFQCQSNKKPSIIPSCPGIATPLTSQADHGRCCCRCQCERTALKQMSIRQLPPVLCLHMKRFKATDKGATMKVDSRVVFPVGHLEMAPFTSAPVLAARCHLKGLLLAEPSRYVLMPCCRAKSYIAHEMPYSSLYPATCRCFASCCCSDT